MESRLGKSYNDLDHYNQFPRNPNYANEISAREIKLNVQNKRNSSGIRDDESLLCPTPPEGQDYMGQKFQQQYFNPQINVSVNIDGSAFG